MKRNGRTWAYALFPLLFPTLAFACWSRCEGSRDECNARMIESQLPVVTDFLVASPDYCRDKAPGEYRAPLRGEGVAFSADPGATVHCTVISSWLEVSFTTEPRQVIVYPMGATARLGDPLVAPAKKDSRPTTDANGYRVVYLDP